MQVEIVVSSMPLRVDQSSECSWSAVDEADGCISKDDFDYI